MKKSTLLACAAALVISTGVVGAQSAPTYDDNLILRNPVSAPALGNVVLVPVASPQTVSAVHDYVKAWQNAEINIAKAKVKYENHERMTKAGYIPMINTTMLTTSVLIPSVVYMVKKCS